MKDPFKVLGIEPTSEKRQIKKAYAKLAARYHPEEYPEKWQEIHEAYEAALDLASVIEEALQPEEREQEEKTFQSERRESEEKAFQSGQRKQKERVLPDEEERANIPEVIPLEHPKDMEEASAPFDFEQILSKLDQEQEEDNERTRQELLSFLEPLWESSEQEAMLWNVFFQSEVFRKNQFQPVLWEICSRILEEREVSEKSFHIIWRQIALTKQELEEKMQSSGYIPEHLESLDQVLNRTARAVAAARKGPATGKKKPKKQIGRIRKISYLFVAAIGLLAFFFLPRTRETGKTWDQQREELAENMDAADKLIQDTHSTEREFLLVKEEMEKEGVQSLLRYLTEKYAGTKVAVPEYHVYVSSVSGWDQTYISLELRKKGTEEAFAWLWRDENGEKYFDSLQKEAVEAAMQAEVAAVIGSEEGFVKTEVAKINSTYGTLQVPWLGKIGYHTKLEQDLESFWEQEKQYRLTKPGSDQMLEAFAGENQKTRYCNDAFVVCLKDPAGTTLEDYANVMSTRAEEFARYEAALRQLEEKYGTELEVALYLPEEQMPVTMLYKKGTVLPLEGMIVSEAEAKTEEAYQLIEEVCERKDGANENNRN